MVWKYLLFVALFLTSIYSTIAQKNKDIIIGKVDSIYSNILKEKRKIWVYLPKKPTAATKFPVLYLLDGDGHFHSATGIIQQLSQINGNTVLPEMMVVAILNTDRVRDLTPTAAKKDIPFFKDSGGGVKFTAFLQRELIPFIEKKYPASAGTHKTIVGHSLGGLMAINTLLENPDMFNAYIAIDPTITWDNQMILKKAEQLLKTKKLMNKKLYLSFANTMRSGMDTAMARNDTSISTFHIRSILQLTDRLKNDKVSGLNWRFAYYPNDSHGSVPLISEYDGLRYIFDFYPEPSYADPVYPDFPVDVDSLFTAHYNNVSKNLGYKVVPDEFAISRLGYGFMEDDKMSITYSCFKMNIRNYPKSHRVYNSMGDYYNKMKDTTKAIEFYSKSLTIQESVSTRQKLNKLLNNNASK